MKNELDIKKIKKEVKGLLKRTKHGLQKMGEEASTLAKRSEKELSKVAKIGKAEMDILGLNIKKNQLYYELGKKVSQLHTQGKLTTKNLKKLCDRIELIEKDLKSRKRSISRYLKKK